MPNPGYKAKLDRVQRENVKLRARLQTSIDKLEQSNSDFVELSKAWGKLISDRLEQVAQSKTGVGQPDVSPGPRGYETIDHRFDGLPQWLRDRPPLTDAEVDDAVDAARRYLEQSDPTYAVEHQRVVVALADRLEVALAAAFRRHAPLFDTSDTDTHEIG